MIRSVLEYLREIGWAWYVLILGLVSGVLGWIQDLVNSGVLPPMFDAIGLPPVVWYLLSLTVVLVAPFLAFHRIRVQRDKALSDRAPQERLVSVRDGFRELERRARIIVDGFEKKQKEAHAQAAGDALVYEDQIKNADTFLADEWRTEFIEYIRDHLGRTQAMPYEKWAWFESSEPVTAKEALRCMQSFVGAANDFASTVTLLDLSTP